MNKKKLLLLGLIATTACTMACGFLGVDMSSSFASGGLEPFSCSEYWNDEYTSLYEITHDSSSAGNEFKTWGTVSKVFTQNNKVNFFIQSTDENGHKAGALIYQGDQNVAVNVEVGNVVTIEGTYTIYNGCQEFTNATITIDHQENVGGSIVPLNLSKNYWIGNYTDSMKDAYNDMYGYVQNVKVIKIGTTYYGEFSDQTAAPLFVKPNLGSGDTTTIKNKLESLTNGTRYDITIHGIFEYYSKNTTMQLQVLHLDDIDGDVDEPADIKITSIDLGTREMEINLGESVQMEATITPANATNQTLSWESNDESIVTINSSGRVTGVALGYTYIVVQSTDGSNVYDYCRVDVVDNGVKVQSVNFNKEQMTLELGLSEALIATVLPENADNKELIWTTSNSSVATVDQYGLVTAVALGTAYIYADTTDDSYLYAQCEVNVVEPTDYTTVTYDVSYVSGMGSYSTGNYGYSYISGTKFVYYRATQGMNLLPVPAIAQNYGDNGLAGSIMNVEPIGGIHSITVNYSTQYSSGTNPVVSYGSTLNYASTEQLPFSTSSTSYTINTANTTQFFRISCGNCKITVSSISVEYDSNISSYTPALINPTTISTRVNPTKYSGTLVAGSSQVTVPYKGSTKTFTYYTEEYVADHPECLEDAAMITPEDISAYVIAFGTWPANVQNVTSNSEVFGNLTRRLSPKYERTDGYAVSVPYSTGGYSKPVYYEIDIALVNSYSPSSRGVGRVVVWMYGFDDTGYDNSIVCTYTDDHYATFQEYANNGYFMPRFNGEQPMTAYSRVA